MESAIKDTENLNYLYTPVSSTVSTPVETKLHHLPIEELAWEDFEKLCLAIVQTEFSINDCEIYGTKGQAQAGIDIYARKANGKYSAYQCKRYETYKISNLDDAVSYFRKGKYADISDEFVICTSCEWNTTQIQDRFEELKQEYKSKYNIELVKWDKIQLERKLKDFPQIVFDFFGIEWVRKFNGDLAVKSLSGKKKLDAVQIDRFRRELSSFYSTLFNVQDPGIPIQELKDAAYSLEERFVIPDIVANIHAEYPESKPDAQTVNNRCYDGEADQFYYDEYSGYRVENMIHYNQRKKEEKIIETNDYELRINIDEALVNSKRNVIIGDPGSGKSTLLRFIVLDILSSHPVLKNVSREYGKLLPVWIPFAYITKHISSDDSISISELVRRWFKSLDKEKLFEVVQDALEDERLFLIIDGIDEWNNISAAQQAIDRISMTAGLHGCHVLYSSRPYGFKLLKDSFKEVNELNLALFSPEQQREFITNWYGKWLESQHKKDEDFARKQAEGFMDELSRVGGLKKLAENPLLLSILIVQKICNSVLPKNKIKALDEITKYLIDRHPVKRQKDAGIVVGLIDDSDFRIRDIFCELAIKMQKESNDGTILKQDAYKVISDYLQEYAGFDKAKAKKRSQEMIDIGANYFGIIIEKSCDEIAFSHRQFQEYLAAEYLSDSDQEVTAGILKENGANPVFHQVIINFFGLIPAKKRKEYYFFLESLKNAKCEIYQRNHLKLITYEVSVTLDNAPYEMSVKSFESMVQDFEYETDFSFKKALLGLILDAFSINRLQDLVGNFICNYFPSQNQFRDYRIVSLMKMEHLTTWQIEFVKKALINGTVFIRLDASDCLRKHIKEDSIFQFIEHLVTGCKNPDILPFAINSVISSDIERGVIDKLLANLNDENPLTRFFLIKYKVFIGNHSDADLDELALISKELTYPIKDEVVKVLIDGFSGNEKLKTLLLETVKSRKYFRQQAFDNDIAWKVLISCFNKDEDVIERIKKELETEEYVFVGTDHFEIWKLLYCHLKGAEELLPVVENWIMKRSQNKSCLEPSVAFACLLVHTEKIKELIFENLLVSTVPHWPVMVLLEGWKEEKEVKDRLKGYFRNKENKYLSYAASYVSEVFNDSKEEGVKILEDVLFDSGRDFRERAIPALIELDKTYFEEKLLSRLLDEIDCFPKDGFERYYAVINDLFKYFPENSRIKGFISQNIGDDLKFYNLAIQYCPDSVENRKSFLEISLPLHKELRLGIIERLDEYEVLPDKILNTLASFKREEDKIIKADTAICLFTHLNKYDLEKILVLCKPLVFGCGFDFQIQRNIAFTGYLMTHRLPEYFQMQEESSLEKAAPVNLFDENYIEDYVSGYIIRTLINEFDYLISIVGEDFNLLFQNGRSSVDLQKIWGFFARYSGESSPAFSHIKQFISEQSENINDHNLINFLSRITPRGVILKNILLGIVDKENDSSKALAGRLLGVNFSDDPQVYETVRSVCGYEDYGKIIALCNGWPEESVLKQIFDDLIVNQPCSFNEYAGFELKFLFREVDNLTDFLYIILSNIAHTKYHHKYFYIPLIERLRRDKQFVERLKKELLSAETVSEKISFYNLLVQVNGIDDKIKEWKKCALNEENGYGYDIVSNKVICISDVLYDYNF